MTWVTALTDFPGMTAVGHWAQLGALIFAAVCVVRIVWVLTTTP